MEPHGNEAEIRKLFEDRIKGDAMFANLEEPARTALLDVCYRWFMAGWAIGTRTFADDVIRLGSELHKRANHSGWGY